jgi:hypothetical protein
MQKTLNNPPDAGEEAERMKKVHKGYIPKDWQKWTLFGDYGVLQYLIDYEDSKKRDFDIPSNMTKVKLTVESCK